MAGRADGSDAVSEAKSGACGSPARWRTPADRRRARRAAAASADGLIASLNDRVFKLQGLVDQLQLVHDDAEVRDRLSAVIPIIIEEVRAVRDGRQAQHRALDRVWRNVALHLFKIPMADLRRLDRKGLNAAQRSQQLVAAELAPSLPAAESSCAVETSTEPCLAVKTSRAEDAELDQSGAEVQPPTNPEETNITTERSLECSRADARTGDVSSSRHAVCWCGAWVWPKRGEETCRVAGERANMSGDLHREHGETGAHAGDASFAAEEDHRATSSTTGDRSDASWDEFWQTVAQDDGDREFASHDALMAVGTDMDMKDAEWEALQGMEREDRRVGRKHTDAEWAAIWASRRECLSELRGEPRLLPVPEPKHSARATCTMSGSTNETSERKGSAKSGGDNAASCGTLGLSTSTASPMRGLFAGAVQVVRDNAEAALTAAVLAVETAQGTGDQVAIDEAVTRLQEEYAYHRRVQQST